jgi:hypothetical protein
MRGSDRVAAATALSAGLLGGAAWAAAPVAPMPPASELLLTPADFDPGAAVAADTTVTKAGVQLNLRLFKGARLGGQPVVAVAEAELEHDENAASSEFAVMRTELGLNVEKKAFADFFSAQFAKGAKVGSSGKAKVTVKSTVIGRPVSVGSDAFRVPLTFVTSRGRLRAALGFAHADRAIGIVFLIPFRGELLAPAKVARVVAADQRHLRAAFTVANGSPPTIVGTPQQGRTVSVNVGAWTGAPSSFAYAWSRCDSSGSSCAPIAGATASMYAVTAADSGATLRVAVTGSNSVSSQQASSPPTVVAV